MKKFLSTHGRTLALAGVLVLLLGLLAYVALRAGPLAPVPVTLATVESREITPALFGIGTVEARYTHMSVSNKLHPPVSSAGRRPATRDDLYGLSCSCRSHFSSVPLALRASRRSQTPMQRRLRGQSLLCAPGLP